MNEIAVRDPGGLEDLKEQVRMVVNTQFVPEHLRGNPYACLAACLYGREIGLAPMESLSEVYMVDGRPALSAKAMVKLTRRAGHRITGVATDQEATVTGTRSDGSEMTVTFTMEEASRIKRGTKKLTDGTSWQNYPSDMLWARAVSRLCRRLFSDVFGALPYGPDEMAFAGTVPAVDDLPLVEPAGTMEEEGSLTVEGSFTVERPRDDTVEFAEPEIVTDEELREDKLRESTHDEPEPEEGQESLGSEFVRMAEEAQTRRRETGE